MRKLWVITRKCIEPKPIIEASLYRPDISLNALIQELCDPMRFVTTDDIINICVKYFFAHRHPDSVNTHISLRDIESLYALWLKYIELSRYKVKEITLKDNSKKHDLEYFISNGYGTSMLWDIAPSVEIFRAIVDEVIDSNDFDGKYFWLDLWTGTGWLMLAQYISAKRKGFSDIYISWIDKDESMLRSTAKLLVRLAWEKCEVWIPLLWDTVDDLRVYDTVLKMTDDRPLTYVSNENIPTCSIKMDGDNDPFFQNVFAVDVCMEDKIIKATRGFPKKIEYIVLCPWNKPTPVLWDFQQRYQLGNLVEVNNYMYPDKTSDDTWIMKLQVFENVTPYWIDLWWDQGVQKLTDIGKSLESEPWKWGKVFPAHMWKRRWDW